MARLGTATLLLYLVATFGVWLLVVAYRVQRLQRPGSRRRPLAGRLGGGREPVVGRGGTLTTFPPY